MRNCNEQPTTVALINIPGQEEGAGSCQKATSGS